MAKKKKSSAKKKGGGMLTKIIAVCAVVLVLGAAVFGVIYFLGGNDDESTLFSERYVTVPVNVMRAQEKAKVKPAAAKLAEEEDAPYYLAYSGYSDTSNFYVYYLGYIKSVPIVSGTAIRYDGKTPINITYTKDSSVENAVTKSMTTANEYSTTKHQETSFSVTVTASWKTGFLGTGAGGSVSGTVGGLFSWEQTNTRSVSNTVQQAEAKMSGESFSISATIGDHGEKSGTYRYALFGTTDVYFIAELSRDNSQIKSAENMLCARNDIAWGIDYSLNGEYGKTSDSENLTIPDEDFTKLPLPTKEMDKLPEETPTQGWAYKEVTVGPITGTTAGAKIDNPQGDEEVDDHKDRRTEYTLQVSISEGSSARYLNASFTYTVREDYKKNPTVLVITYTKEIDLGDLKFLELAPTSTYISVSGKDPANTTSHDFFSAVKSSNKDELIKNLDVKIDGPTRDHDEDGIAFKVTLRIKYLKSLV